MLVYNKRWGEIICFRKKSMALLGCSINYTSSYFRSSLLSKDKNRFRKGWFLMHSAKLEKCIKLHLRLWGKSNQSQITIISKSCSTFCRLNTFLHYLWAWRNLARYYYSLNVGLYLVVKIEQSKVWISDNKSFFLVTRCPAFLWQSFSKCGWASNTFPLKFK